MTTTEKHRQRVRYICDTLAQRIGAKRILFGHRLVNDKYKQFVALLNIKTLIDELKKYPLAQLTLVITERTFKIDRRRLRLYLPYQFGITDLTNFLLQEKERNGL